MQELAADGYIFVIQNLRGRFKSEGVFSLSSWVDPKDPKATNETTDAYDSIQWLVNNVPNNNGKVGMYGVSYDLNPALSSWFLREFAQKSAPALKIYAAVPGFSFRVTSALHRLCVMNSMQYLLCPSFDERRIG
jgi:predicted acyl esterase